MFFGTRNGVEVLLFVLSWAAAVFFTIDLASAGNTSALLTGLLVAVAAVAVLVLAWRADDLLFGLGRTTRGPTDEENRRHGELRRHSHPDTAGKPRPRAPGPHAGTGSTAAL
ncbi:hypothetical protein EV641_118108 [Rhodococcus sp. SMB37]|uniref:DUF6412 domain-containing protein n=1 Tax=Rhodococcus sp. SMB37 TaxID=2512213 RepID=UPI00104C176C|nr:DUF6412 domain-containing protein [Rhodococcus sp. SMB37]TCN48184.1 hypothetical protein EV641_118108 [Rhodococcus sp. SMB37]